MNKYLIFLIAFFSGLLGVFAFAPFDCWPLAYISLLGLLWVAKQTQKSVAFIGKSCCGGSRTDNACVYRILAVVNYMPLV